MLRQCQNKDQTAQIFLEYVLVVGAVVMVLFAMSTLIKRGAQGMIKVVADQIGNQVNAEQDFASGAFLRKSYSSTRATTSKIKTELLGQTTYTYADVISTTSNASINMGFTAQN